jgi:ergothioneine biosynthesis protein EgtB
MALNQPLTTRLAEGEKLALPQTSVSRPSSETMRRAPAGDVAVSKSTSRLTTRSDEQRRFWCEAYDAVRRETEERAAPLAPEDQVIQSMSDASPTKWHRAHTTWFFEQFLVTPKLADYRVFDERFAFLFNSYYVAAGPRHERPKRGLITRPTCDEVAAYRTHVDAAVARMLATVPAEALDEILPILELGLHHEQQHQELILTDILHAFAQNPCAPSYDLQWSWPDSQASDGVVTLDGGVYRIGHDGDGFMFDNEGPAHEVLLQPVRLGNLITNAEWLEFMADGGYRTPAHWLSDGWTAVGREGWEAPLYWEGHDGRWLAMSLAGLHPVERAAPVCHISYYEADAFARWAGKRLPTEFEWEVAAQGLPIAETGAPDVRPLPAQGPTGDLRQMFGAVWQWTQSAYLPYPGYRPPAGALGEYNGKFMVSQQVLRGGSCATPPGHTRATYRNFFYPHQRWQFTGLRLASEIT